MIDLQSIITEARRKFLDVVLLIWDGFLRVLEVIQEGMLKVYRALIIVLRFLKRGIGYVWHEANERPLLSTIIGVLILLFGPFIYNNYIIGADLAIHYYNKVEMRGENPVIYIDLENIGGIDLHDVSVLVNFTGEGISKETKILRPKEPPFILKKGETKTVEITDPILVRYINYSDEKLCDVSQFVYEIEKISENEEKISNVLLFCLDAETKNITWKRLERDTEWIAYHKSNFNVTIDAHTREKDFHIKQQKGTGGYTVSSIFPKSKIFHLAMNCPTGIIKEPGQSFLFRECFGKHCGQYFVDRLESGEFDWLKQGVVFQAWVPGTPSGKSYIIPTPNGTGQLSLNYTYIPIKLSC
jgi:hypothetical protein